MHYPWFLLYGRTWIAWLAIEIEMIWKRKCWSSSRKPWKNASAYCARASSRTEQDGRTADVSDSAQDIADRASSSYQKEFLFHQSNNDRQLLQMVDSALERIRQGTYGECISCGDEINSKRLQAVPWTRYCISCQEKQEQGLLQEETGT